MEQSAREGVIVKGVGGLYYARQPDGEVHVLRAKGKFRKQHVTPMVGDQIFTDIWGARRAGCKAVLVSPIQREGMLFFRFKRFLERIVLRLCPRSIKQQILYLGEE